MGEGKEKLRCEGGWVSANSWMGVGVLAPSIHSVTIQWMCWAITVQAVGH